jgi:hypothetical protein
VPGKRVLALVAIQLAKAKAQRSDGTTLAAGKALSLIAP